MIFVLEVSVPLILENQWREPYKKASFAFLGAIGILERSIGCLQMPHLFQIFLLNYLLNGIQPLTTFMGPCRDRIWYIIFSSFWLAPHQWCFHWYSCHNEHSMYKEIPTLNPRPHILVKIFKWAYLWLSHYPKYFKLLYIDIFGMQQSTTAYTNNILNSQILAKNLQC